MTAFFLRAGAHWDGLLDVKEAKTSPLQHTVGHPPAGVRPGDPPPRFLPAPPRSAPYAGRTCSGAHCNIPGTIVVTDDARSRDTFVAGLPYGYTLVTEALNSIRVADLSPADLGMALSLAEKRGLTAQLVQGQKRLVTRVSSRLCAWEFDLASEALAERACCTRCGGRAFTLVTIIEAEKRLVQYWCAGCAGSSFQIEYR